MAAERFDEALLSEFFAGVIEGFRDAVGIEGKGVARGELAFADRAIPVAEKAENGAGGIEALESLIVAEEQRAEMPAIGVAQAPDFVVVLGEEQRGVGAVDRIFIEEPVHGLQELLRLI